MTLMEVKGHHRSNGVNYVLWHTIFGQKKHRCKLKMMMTLMEVKGHQSSNGVNICSMATIFLIKRSADAN